MAKRSKRKHNHRGGGPCNIVGPVVQGVGDGGTAQAGAASAAAGNAGTGNVSSPIANGINMFVTNVFAAFSGAGNAIIGNIGNGNAITAHTGNAIATPAAANTNAVPVDTIADATPDDEAGDADADVDHEAPPKKRQRVTDREESRTEPVTKLEAAFPGETPNEENVLPHQTGDAEDVDRREENLAPQEIALPPARYRHSVAALLRDVMADGSMDHARQLGLMSSMLASRDGADVEEQIDSFSLKCAKCGNDNRYGFPNSSQELGKDHVDLPVATDHTTTSASVILAWFRTHGIICSSCRRSSTQDETSHQVDRVSCQGNTALTRTPRTFPDGYPKQEHRVQNKNNLAVALGPLLGKLFENPDVLSQFHGNHGPVDFQSVSNLPQGQLHAAHIAAKHLKSATDRAMRKDDNLSRDVEANKEMVMNNDSLYMEHSYVSHRKQETDLLDPGHRTYESTRASELINKIRPCYVYSRHDSYFDVLWFMTFNGQGLRHIKFDQRPLFLGTEHLSTISRTGRETKKVKVYGEDFKDNFILVLRERREYHEAMSPARGGIIPECKPYLDGYVKGASCSDDRFDKMTTIAGLNALSQTTEGVQWRKGFQDALRQMSGFPASASCLRQILAETPGLEIEDEELGQLSSPLGAQTRTDGSGATVAAGDLPGTPQHTGVNMASSLYRSSQRATSLRTPAGSPTLIGSPPMEQKLETKSSLTQDDDHLAGREAYSVLASSNDNTDSKSNRSGRGKASDVPMSRPNGEPYSSCDSAFASHFRRGLGD